MEAMVSQTTAARTALDEQRAEVQSMHDEISGSHEKIEEAEAKIMGLLQQTEAGAAAQAETRAKLEETLAAHPVTELAVQATEAVEAVRTLDMRLAENTGRVGEVEADVEGLSEQVSVVTGDQKEAAAALTKLEGATSDAQDAVKAEVDALKLQLASMKEEIAAAVAAAATNAAPPPPVIEVSMKPVTLSEESVLENTRMLCAYELTRLADGSSAAHRSSLSTVTLTPPTTAGAPSGSKPHDPVMVHLYDSANQLPNLVQCGGRRLGPDHAGRGTSCVLPVAQSTIGLLRAQLELVQARCAHNAARYCPVALKKREALVEPLLLANARALFNTLDSAGKGAIEVRQGGAWMETVLLV